MSVTPRRTDYLPKKVIEDTCTCAGVFLIRQSPLNVLLVESRRKRFQFSFPKGKRNKNEDSLTAAKRELYEETGISEENYELYPNRWYIEYRPDLEKPHIVYYLAILRNNNVVLNPQDTKEIVSAGWFAPTDIYQMKKTFYLQRRQIVSRATKHLGYVEESFDKNLRMHDKKNEYKKDETLKASE